MFASDLDSIILKYDVDAWLFGHTHTRINMKIGNTIIKCNPLGYELYDGKYENSKYNKEEVLTISI